MLLIKTETKKAHGEGDFQAKCRLIRCTYLSSSYNYTGDHFVGDGGHIFNSFSLKKRHTQKNWFTLSIIFPNKTEWIKKVNFPHFSKRRNAGSSQDEPHPVISFSSWKGSRSRKRNITSLTLTSSSSPPGVLWAVHRREETVYSRLAVRYFRLKSWELVQSYRAPVYASPPLTLSLSFVDCSCFPSLPHPAFQHGCCTEQLTLKEGGQEEKPGLRRRRQQREWMDVFIPWTFKILQLLS